MGEWAVSKRKLLSVAALAAIIGLAASPAQADKVCKPRVLGAAAHGPIRATVEARAVAFWTARATARHTLQYANWDNASDRSVGCRRYTSVLGVNLWECRARANPCRLR
jgi:hypothetical protein